VPGLAGRHTERGVLDQLVEAITHAGESRTLVIHGDTGAGKTALLDYLATHAPGCRVARGAGIQSEMELAFAGLHQLCAPMLDRLDALPPPQRDALRTVFGMSAGPAPDRFLIGLAVLGLLSHVAAEQVPGSSSRAGPAPHSTTASATMTRPWRQASTPPPTTGIWPRSAGR
jgi:hypothetical protein